jgi:pimeloyl-ACP methyl ester carboxylesterase
MVGLDWVSADPTRFERLVIMNTSCANLCWPHQRLRPERLLNLLKIRSLKSDPVAREREILKLTTAHHDQLDELSKIWGLWSQEKPLRVKVAVAQLFAATRFIAPKEVPIPMLVFAGAQDHFVSPESSKRIADFYEAPFMAHPSGGHDLFVDDPRWILDRLQEWLASR